MKKYVSILLSAVLILSICFITYGQEDACYERGNYGYIPYDREEIEYKPDNCISLFSASAIPKSYDTRAFGYQSPVKNQGAGNTCWAFSAIGALESYLLKSDFTPKDENGKVTDNTIYDFSENHMQYMCSSWNNNPLGFDIPPGANKYDENGKLIPGGGNSFFASTYFMNDFGPVLEEYVPYTNINTMDYSATKDAPLSRFRVDSVEFIPVIDVPTMDEFKDPAKNENKILLYNYYLSYMKLLIMEYGSVIGSVNYSSQYMTADKKNLYCNMKGTNHQILIVGWDDTYSKENFRSEPYGDGAFIIKNSHGKNNNDNGYFYLSYYDYNLFSDNMAITSVSIRNKDEILYNLDPYCNCMAIYYNVKDVPITYGNSFTKKTDNESLFGFKTYMYSGIEYNVYFVDSNSIANYKNTCVLREYSPLESGYYTFYLDEEIPILYDDFEIIVEATNPYGGYVVCPIESNISASAVIDNQVVSIPVVSKVEIGNYESIVKVGNSSWGLFSGDKNWGNFCIKALTKTTDSYLDFEFSNFTDLSGAEKTSFSNGDTVVIHPAFNGANIDGKQIICIGYRENRKLPSVITFSDMSGERKHGFIFENIPADFSSLEFYLYAWEMGKLKPLGNKIKVGK